MDELPAARLCLGDGGGKGLRGGESLYGPGEPTKRNVRHLSQTIEMPSHVCHKFGQVM